MGTPSERFVPKIHPASRPAEADDPYALNATAVPGGDPEVMLECLVQEYSWMGWDTAHMLGLFRDPCYPALNALLDHYGEDGVRRRIARVLDRMGVFRVSGSVSDEPESDEDEQEPELIELSIARALTSRGDRHAQGI
jgi:hypothetical protein